MFCRSPLHCALFFSKCPRGKICDFQINTAPAATSPLTNKQGMYKQWAPPLRDAILLWRRSPPEFAKTTAPVAVSSRAKTVLNEVPFVRFYPLPCLFSSNREVRGCLEPMRSGADERNFALLQRKAAPLHASPQRSVGGPFSPADLIGRPLAHRRAVGLRHVKRCCCRMARALRRLALVGFFGGDSGKKRKLS
ncbi:hypothetical protein TRVL_09318 [Trypanosoma vivax]|nr:hypothetical protein TRVL_09318 [Trypanosoma vivax]